MRRDGAWPARIRAPHKGTLPTEGAYPFALPPIGHVAPIASTEAVLDDPDSELEALIADGYGDTCVVEMEGYGAVFAASQERTPSIVIRGVSDMTQGKSYQADAERQPVAACHAAAFAFEMLSHWAQLNPAPGEREGAEAPERPLATPSAAEEGSEPRRSSDEAPAPESLGAERAPAAPCSNIVLTLQFDADPEDPQLALTIQAALRQAAQSDEIVVIRLERGSIRAFVTDPAGVLLGDLQAVRAALLAEQGWRLLGAVPLQVYEQTTQLSHQMRAASRELMAWPATLPDGAAIERQEFGELRDRVDQLVGSTTVLLGEPGSGKSTLLATLASHYHALGWPVLAIKADLLDPEMESEADLQTQLGLNQAPSQALAAIARSRPVLLVIDQLDALAGYLDIRTARLSVLLNLVRRVGALDNVHVVLSARPFEFNHDVRLRAVVAERLTLELPAWSTVLQLLEARGVNAGGWPSDAQDVMRRPQALATYLHLKDRGSAQPFTSYQAMLEQLWRERVLVGTDGARRARLASEIAEHMAEEESLWLAEVRFEDRADDVAALAAAGILTTLDGSIGFAHQIVFDFALSRSFAREPGKLSSFAIERQASIFLRPKLWAGLNYLRGVDPVAYQRELETVWSAPDLRRHLRLLLTEFLGSQNSPTDREALLMGSALDRPEQRWAAYRAIAGSPGWFARFARSYIASAM